jgi:thiamine transport system permease protein
VLGAVFSLPYAVHLASARLAHHALAHDRLCAAFGIAGWHRFRLIDVPALRRPAGLALALGAALGAGDLGAIALFGDQNTETLALRLYRQIAGYRLDEAAVTALVHVVVVVVLFVVIERWVGGRDRG